VKKVLHEKVDLTGHVLVRRTSFYTHAVEFTPLALSFVRVRSWNAPSDIRYPAVNWILVSAHKMKKAPGRELWRDMRKRGYWVWLGGRSKEQEASCAT
jgi:hypothetical protein